MKKKTAGKKMNLRKTPDFKVGTTMTSEPKGNPPAGQKPYPKRKLRNKGRP